MTRLIAIILFCAGIFCLAQSHAQVPMTGAGLGAPASGFTPSCTQSSTFLTAATTVTLTADKTNYDTLICGLVSDGEWNFDVLYIWAAPNQTAALINLAQPGTFNGTLGVAAGTCGSPPCFTAYHGYTGDAATFYIDTSYNPATAPSPNFVQNSATVGVYDLTSRTTGQGWWALAASDAAGIQFVPLQVAGPDTSGAFINSATFITGNPPPPTPNAQGLWNYTRTSSVLQSLYATDNETSFASSADTSIAPHNSGIFFFSATAGFGNTGDQFAAGWIGKGLAAADVCKVARRINTYMTNLASPINVFTNGGSAC